ncbi:hypothetical protein RRG08_044140 [Elysia crispata]|uniref:Uncharacterized protein n=1 Tax=Elysia crispata TaxID=231223 RepID=A0AAE0Z7G4_9GAST|nr:hypothetical protein RRG08_044140 [Elysia crispata]
MGPKGKSFGKDNEELWSSFDHVTRHSSRSKTAMYGETLDRDIYLCGSSDEVSSMHPSPQTPGSSDPSIGFSIHHPLCRSPWHSPAQLFRLAGCMHGSSMLF